MARTPTARRRTLRTAAVTAVALGLGLTACTAGTQEPAASPVPRSTAPEPSPTAEPTTEPTAPSSPADGAALVDGTRQVDVQTYGGLWVATSVEGGITTVADPAASAVPTTWVVEPVAPAGGGARALLRSTATVDDRDLCLNTPGDGVLGLETCDPASPSQQLAVGATDQPDRVNITTADGYLVAAPDGGLALAPDAASPGTVFTLVDRGPA